MLLAVGCDRPDFGTKAETGEVIDTDVDREAPVEDDGDDQGPAPNGPEEGPVVGGSDAPPTASPDPTREFGAIIDANADLGFDAYRALADQPGSFVVGSYGLTRSAAVASLGAAGIARADLEMKVSNTLVGDELHSAFNALDLDITTRDSLSRIDLITAAWVPTAVEVEQQFVDDLARYYGLTVRRAEFAIRPEDARVSINNFYRSNTGGALTDVVPVRTVDPTTELLITDGNVFRGVFEDAFDPAYTEDAEFSGSAGVRTVPMMRREGTIMGTTGNGYRAVELPFDGGFSVLLVLPDEGRFAEVESDFDITFVNEVLAGLVPSYLVLGVPRASVTGRVDAMELAPELGLENAFASDFSAVHLDAKLSNIVQRTQLQFVEDGVNADPVDLPPLSENEAMDADVPSLFFSRSFLFVVRDSQTGAVLFLGRVD
jgi:serpin B